MSGIEFQYGEGEQPALFEVQERLALTEDDRLVPEDHPDARWLYAVPGRMIPMDEAIRYGLARALEQKADPQAKKPLRRRTVKKGDRQ